MGKREARVCCGKNGYKAMNETSGRRPADATARERGDGGIQ